MAARHPVPDQPCLRPLRKNYPSEYEAWVGMKQRCYNPNNSGYKNYGARGIMVCKEWRKSFAQFLADVGPRPSVLYSLDRINNDGDYEPSNVQWATRTQQNKNTRQARVLEYNGKRMNAGDWAKELGISPVTMSQRLKKFPVDVALGMGRGGTRTTRISDLSQKVQKQLWPEPPKGFVCDEDAVWPKETPTGRLRPLRAWRSGRAVRWECVCQCGTVRFVEHENLRRGHTRSCGCLKREKPGRLSHGMSYTREHHAYCGMMARCHNPNSPAYNSYGGRGILVCDRWRGSFDNFFFDMGPCPDHSYSLDRADNNKGYSPENCRWATKAEQSRNRRNCRPITHLGRTMTMAEWSRELGISVAALSRRLSCCDNPEDAIAYYKCKESA